MIAIGSDINPPAPRPCTPRKQMSSIIDCARPDRIDPTRKMTIAAWKMRLAPVQVAELALDRGRAGGREQVGRHHPREVVEPAQVADDGGQRGGDDGLVERGQQHAEHEGA